MTLGILVTLALSFLSTAPIARAQSAADRARVSGWVTFDDGTPIAGARVLITERFDVSTRDFTDPGFGTDPDLGTAATTDAAGHYDAPDVPAGASSRDLWVVAHVPGRGVLWHREAPAIPEQPVPTRAGDDRIANVRYPEGGSTLRGTVAIRGGRAPERTRLTATSANGDERTVAHAGRDGTFEIAVPPSTRRLRVSSRLGLERSWPGIPLAWGDEAAPPIPVTAGQALDLGTITLPERLRYDAVDEYGAIEPGVDGPAPDGTVGAYPFDVLRPPGRVVGPRLIVGTPVGLAFPGVSPTTELTTMTGLSGVATLTLTNTGDDDVQMSAPRFEGPDAARFSCRSNVFAPLCGRRALQPLFAPDGSPRPGGSSFLFEISLDTTTYRDTYRATMVFDTNTPAGTVRIPFTVRNLLPPGIQANALPSIADTPRVIADLAIAHTRLGRALAAVVRLARTSVRATFPAAGTARVQIDRRTTTRKTGRVRHTWTLVRTVRIEATRRTTITRKLKPLARGTYRLRVRTTVRGRKTHTATVVRTIRR